MLRYAGYIFALIVFSLMGVAFWYLNETLPKSSAAFYNSNYSKALADSQKDNKPVIIIFTASWCGPCQHMKQNVYSSPQVNSVADRFHWLMLDVDSASNQDLAKKYGVRGIPHIQIIDGYEKRKGKVVGGQDASTFAAFLRKQL